MLEGNRACVSLSHQALLYRNYGKLYVPTRKLRRAGQRVLRLVEALFTGMISIERQAGYRPAVALYLGPYSKCPFLCTLADAWPGPTWLESTHKRCDNLAVQRRHSAAPCIEF